MTLHCNVHNALFKEGATRWCKKSSPNDTCEPVEVQVQDIRGPRMLPIASLLLLASRVNHPGWLDFLITAQQMGFGIDQPGDHDLPTDEWEQIALSRVDALVMSFDRLMNKDEDSA